MTKKKKNHLAPRLAKSINTKRLSTLACGHGFSNFTAITGNHFLLRYPSG